MVDRPRSRPKQASKQLFLQCVITTYNLRTLQGLLQSTDNTQWEEVPTPYTVQR